MNIISKIIIKKVIGENRDISKKLLVLTLALFLLAIVFICGVLATNAGVGIPKSQPRINCASDQKCGQAGFTGPKFCTDTNVFQFYQYPVCIKAGTLESYCNIEKISMKKTDCGVSSCSDSGANYCVMNTVYKNQKCVNKGCKSGTCFRDNYIKTIKVQVCEYGCDKGVCKSPPGCKTDSDCGKTGFFGNEFCSDNDVFKFYQSSICKNPGTKNSYCQLKTDALKIVNCGISECIKDEEKICIGNNVYQNQICTMRGCDSGACFARTDPKEPIAIKNCPDDNSCINGECNCTPKLVISCPDWINISCANNLMNQTRSRTRYDSHNCGTIANSAIIEYRNTISCVPNCIQNWQCTAWSGCSNGYQNRICNDSKNCNNLIGKPAETMRCSSGSCIPFWDCSGWDSCSSGYRERTCTDLYDCHSDFGKPDESEECSTHHYSSDYLDINNQDNYLNNQKQEKPPVITYQQIKPEENKIILDPQKSNSITGASIAVSGNSSIFITLFILALILVILLIVLAVLFRR